MATTPSTPLQIRMRNHALENVEEAIEIQHKSLLLCYSYTILHQSTNDRVQQKRIVELLQRECQIFLKISATLGALLETFD